MTVAATDPLPIMPAILIRSASSALACALGATILGLSVASAIAPSPAVAQVLRVLARVNDDAISDFELQQRVVLAIRSTGLQDSPDLRQRLAPQLLRQMVDEKLQVQEGKRLGLRATDVEIQQRVSELERASGLARGQFVQLMGQMGVPVYIAHQQMEAAISWNKIVRRRVRPTVDVSETEIDDALARVRADVGKPETRIAEIFIPIDRAEQADESKRSADRLVEQLRRGVPFGALAQQFSQGATASAGGDVGYILPGALEPALDRAVQSLQPRQHSEPIRSAAGWHILYVIDRRPFAAARPDDTRLNLVQLTLSLPLNASPDEAQRAMAQAQPIVAGVRQCADLHARARELKGATSGDLNGVRVGDLAGNRDMYGSIPRLNIGQAAGPFRVAEGVQVVSLCSRDGADGLPTRDALGQQILAQKMEAAGRRYMRNLRRTATIELKS
ncbi:MAG: hypothetical protein FJX02_03635 [Alphaproteobacteria bacterium]|nr:hypothetical protein [Alphaproteobacteria bacterium]